MSEHEILDAYELCSKVLAATAFDVGSLLELSNGAETDWLEFKENFNPAHPWRVARAVVALANTHGGCVLLGVNDRGQAIGLNACDPSNLREREGRDAFLRHIEETILRPRTGWVAVKGAKITLDELPPHDLLELYPATQNGTEILAVLVRPRPVGARCIHCVEGPAEKERVFVPVRKLGEFGRVIDLVRPTEIEDWRQQRMPMQARYAELWERFSVSRKVGAIRSEPAAIEKRIAVYFSGLRRTLEEVDRFFIALDAEERTDIVISKPELQPWAEEYLADDLGWDSAPDDELDEMHERPLGDSSDDHRVPRAGGVFDLLAQEQQTILLGEPGAGKTTCLKRLALQVLENYKPGGLVAVFVPLSRYGTTGDLRELIARATRFRGNEEMSLSHTDLAYLLDSDRLVLLLDALNECPDVSRGACIQEIERLLHVHPGVRLTISGRTAGWRYQLRIPAFTVRPLDSVRQQALLTLFLGNERKAAELQRELLAIPGGMTTASNPLVLRMAIQIFQGGDHLPRGRALLYRRFVALWYAREAHKARNAGVTLPWSEGVVLCGLARLAFNARLKGGRVIIRARAEEILSAEVVDPAAFLDRLGQGFLLRSVEDEVDFGHETFQEYFAAEHCLTVPNEIVQTRDGRYSDWAMVLAYAVELAGSEISSPLIEVAWRMNRWLGAVVTPLGRPLPLQWEILTAGLNTLPSECLRLLCQGLPTTEARFSCEPGWYSRQDAALAYSIAVEPAATMQWQQMEVDLLSSAWHPAVAVAFLRRAISDIPTLLALAWPPTSYDKRFRDWHIPKSWLMRATANIARQLIEFGAVRVEDFAAMKDRLIDQANPRHARLWIEAGILKAADFAFRRNEWTADPSLQTIAELIAAGICTFEDFTGGKQAFVAKATPSEAAASITTGVCSPADFIGRKGDWIAKVSAKEARKLINAAICVPADFASRMPVIRNTYRVSTAWQWIRAGVCTSEDFAHRKMAWIASATPKEAQRLISARICAPEDFASRKGRWVATATEITAPRLIAAGICSADDFRSSASLTGSKNPAAHLLRNGELSEREMQYAPSNVVWRRIISPLVQFAQAKHSDLSKQHALLPSDSPLKHWKPGPEEFVNLKRAHKAAERLRVNAGACTYEDYLEFRMAFNHESSEWAELRRLAEAYLESEGIATRQDIFVSSDLPTHTPPYSKEDLTDENTRLALAKQFKGASIIATVALRGEGFCFLSHPDFPDNIFSVVSQRPKGELPLDVGDQVRSEVVIRFDKKRGVWSFAADRMELVERADNNQPV